MKLDKLKKIKTLYFLIGLAVIAFIFGIFFITILSTKDTAIVKEYINTFIANIHNQPINFLNVLKNTFFIHLISIILIWLLGISIIGIPIVIFFYFFKVFSIGFALSSFILTYKSKGLIFSFLYLFPNEIVKFFAYTLIVTNSLNLSKKIINSILKKEQINFNLLLKKYGKILIITIIIIFISSLYETYIIPYIFDKLYFLIK